MDASPLDRLVPTIRTLLSELAANTSGEVKRRAQQELTKLANETSLNPSPQQLASLQEFSGELSALFAAEPSLHDRSHPKFRAIVEMAQRIQMASYLYSDTRYLISQLQTLYEDRVSQPR